MRILVTAGNSQARIDQVRCITNIFSGKTGASLAQEAHCRGHQVVLLTSRPEALVQIGFEPADDSRWRIQPYQTFEELQSLLHAEVTRGNYDAIIHCAAVSDFLCAGIYAPAPETAFQTESAHWNAPHAPRLQDVSRGKVSSAHPELWLRLVPAPKLIDLIRQPWGFQGFLVKFKLEVGKSEAELRAIAESSRLQSAADLLVANTLEDMHQWALLGAVDFRKVPRAELSSALLDLLEQRARR